jgi:hypothetical protein
VSGVRANSSSRRSSRISGRGARERSSSSSRGESVAGNPNGEAAAESDVAVQRRESRADCGAAATAAAAAEDA